MGIKKASKKAYFLAGFIFVLGIAFFVGTLVLGMDKVGPAQQVYLILGSSLVLIIAVLSAVILVITTLNDSLEEILEKTEVKE